jgi:hypothetical protein
LGSHHGVVQHRHECMCVEDRRRSLIRRGIHGLVGRDSWTRTEDVGARCAEWPGPGLDHSNPEIVGGIPGGRRGARFGATRGRVGVLVLVGVLVAATAATGFGSEWSG